MEESDFREDPNRKPKGSIGYWLAYALVAVLFAVGAAVLPSALAQAEELDTQPIADEFQQEIERTAAAYEEASDKLESANKAVKKNSKRIKDLEAKIPEQQERSSVAAREQYKLQQQGSGVIELLFGAESFYDFIVNLDYVSRVSDANMQEMERLSSMKKELEESQKDLVKAQWQAKEQAEEARQALDAAKEARREAQRRAQEEARRQAEAAAAQAAKAAKEAAQAKAAEEARALAEAQQASKSSADEESKASDAAEDAEESKSSASSEDEVAPPSGDIIFEAPSDDGANWDASEAEFIEEWSVRIDAFLDGSPLAGQGATFAKAAWTYGVDPRWSPAISNTESSRGSICFKPHNAWGWGSSSWDSWEEAIDAHVAGLARGYGYTISIGAAQTYCPPNWENWYNDTLSAMNMI